MWPASWKSARQSSTPPIGWITSTTRLGTSIGEQNGRGDLLLALLDVELDVLLRVQVDAEVGQRCLERRHHPVAGERGIPRRRAEQPGRCRTAGPRRDPRRRARGRAGRRRPPTSARWRRGTPGTARPSGRAGSRSRRCSSVYVGAPSARTASADDLGRLELEGEEVLLGQRVARMLEALTLGAVGLVRDRRPDHPVRDLLAVDRRRQPGLEPGGLLVVLTGQVPEIAVAGELPELAGPAVAVDGRADPVGLVEARQLAVPLVDRGRGRACPCGRRSGGSTPRRSPRGSGPPARGSRPARGGSARLPSEGRLGYPRADDQDPDRAEDAAHRHHRAGAAGARRRERRRSRARLRSAHDRRGDDQRGRRPRSSPATSRRRCRRSSTTAGRGSTSRTRTARTRRRTCAAR